VNFHLGFDSIESIWLKKWDDEPEDCDTEDCGAQWQLHLQYDYTNTFQVMKIEWSQSQIMYILVPLLLKMINSFVLRLC